MVSLLHWDFTGEFSVTIVCEYESMVRSFFFFFVMLMISVQIVQIGYSKLGFGVVG